MFRTRTIYTVDFCRDNSTSSIDVHLTKKEEAISLFEGIIAYCSKVLSQKEIKTIIEILETKKEVMLEECDFPAVYDEMLNELIAAYRERYGVKKEKRRKFPYCVDPSELEVMFEQNFDITDVHIDSIDINANLKCGWRDLTLIMKFREVKEDE